MQLQRTGRQLDHIPPFLFVFSNCTLHEVSYISREMHQMKVRDLRKNRQEFKVLWRSDWYTFLKVRQHGRSPSTPPTARGVSGDLAETPPHPASPPSPPLGCSSPSTSSHPSLLRFHFNRWSSSSFHTALWENAVRGEQDGQLWKVWLSIVSNVFIPIMVTANSLFRFKHHSDYQSCLFMSAKWNSSCTAEFFTGCFPFFIYFNSSR